MNNKLFIDMKEVPSKPGWIAHSGRFIERSEVSHLHRGDIVREFAGTWRRPRGDELGHQIELVEQHYTGRKFRVEGRLNAREHEAWMKAHRSRRRPSSASAELVLTTMPDFDCVRMVEI